MRRRREDNVLIRCIRLGRKFCRSRCQEFANILWRQAGLCNGGGSCIRHVFCLKIHFSPRIFRPHGRKHNYQVFIACRASISPIIAFIHFWWSGPLRAFANEGGFPSGRVEYDENTSNAGGGSTMIPW